MEKSTRHSIFLTHSYYVLPFESHYLLKIVNVEGNFRRFPTRFREPTTVVILTTRTKTNYQVSYRVHRLRLKKKLMRNDRLFPERHEFVNLSASKSPG